MCARTTSRLVICKDSRCRHNRTTHSSSLDKHHSNQSKWHGPNETGDELELSDLQPRDPRRRVRGAQLLHVQPCHTRAAVGCPMHLLARRGRARRCSLVRRGRARCGTQANNRSPTVWVVSSARKAIHLAQEKWYDGIWLYAIDKHPTLYARRLGCLVDGHHPGCVDMRQKCAGAGEFDGQSSFIWVPFLRKFLLLTRANRAPIPPGGHRGVQGALGVPCEGRWVFEAFEQIRFPEVPDHSNVYFAHPYVLSSAVLALVFPLAQAPADGGSGLVHLSLLGWGPYTVVHSAPALSFRGL